MGFLLIWGFWGSWVWVGFCRNAESGLFLRCLDPFVWLLGCGWGIVPLYPLGSSFTVMIT